MGLLSIFKRNTALAAEAPAPGAPDAVAAARTRARRRLIGAALLLGVGVIGFPLVFETQPRPIPVNIPIEIPRKDAAAPLTLPAATPPLSAASAAVVAADAERATQPAPAPAKPAEIVERAADQGRELPPAAAAVASQPAPKVNASRPAAAPPAARPADDGARALALLQGQATASAERVVVQVGAYTEADRLRDVRQKVEKLGFKTYTQVVQADGVKHTRVRVGPFASRAEADKAAARIKASGLPVAVLTL